MTSSVTGCRWASSEIDAAAGVVVVSSVIIGLSRTLLATGAWWLVPDHRTSGVAAAVVASYFYARYALATRPLTEESVTAAAPVAH